MTRTFDKGRWSTHTGKFGIHAVWAIAVTIGIAAISNWPQTLADPLAPAEQAAPSASTPAPDVGSHPSVPGLPADSYPSP